MLIRSTELAVLALALACAPAGDGVPPKDDAPELTRLSTDSVGGFAAHSGYETPATLVVRDAATWAEVWATIHDGQLPLPVAPAISFNEEMVLVVAAGQQASGGHAIRFTDLVRDSTGRLVARAVHRSPGADCISTQELTQPVDLARTRWDSTEVMFEISRETAACAP